MNAGGKDEECPLMDELKALVSLQDSIILIDDARCFLGPLPPPDNASDWPRIDEIFSIVKTSFPNHHATIIDDVIVICPSDAQVFVDKYWQETYNKRFSHQYHLEKMPKASIIKHLLGMK